MYRFSYTGTMTKDFAVQQLDVSAFAEAGTELTGHEVAGRHHRLMAETQGRGADVPVNWTARGELRNPSHVHPDAWLHLSADTVLPMICQRCLLPVEMPVKVERSFRFVDDEETAAAADDESEEDLLVISRSFNLMELIEDELLMDLPVAPRHEVCPEPVKLEAVDPDFEEAAQPKANPFALLEKLKTGKS